MKELNPLAMKSNSAHRILVGMVLILAGIILFLKFSGIAMPVFIPHWVFTWPMILIVLGVVFILGKETRSTGTFLLLVGGVFLVHDLFGFGLRTIISYVIPALLVFFGIKMLFPQNHGKKLTGESPEASGFSPKGRLDESVILQSRQQSHGGKPFQGGNVVCIFGGYSLHLKDSQLDQGTSILNITCLFGGCELYIPSDWTVKMEASSVFAGISDKRFQLNPSHTTHDDKVLIVRGSFIFSGLEIKPVY